MDTQTKNCYTWFKFFVAKTQPLGKKMPIISGHGSVLATVKNSAVNTIFPIWSIIKLPNLCFPNTE